MRLTWSTRQRWWLLAGGWLALLVLGITGFVAQSRELDLDTTLLDHLYFTLQLAALNFAGKTEAINWQLQIVRFAAPVLAAGTVIQSASVVFREQLARWRARRARDHVVVCGLDGVGRRLVEALVADGRSVVAVEIDPASTGIAAATRAGVPVVIGDPSEPEVLAAARVDRARRIVATTPSDAVNVAIVSALRSDHGLADRRKGRSPLRCAVRLTDGDLAHLLRSTELGRREPIRVEFFNIHERAAQALLSAHPLALGGDGAGHGGLTPHLLVLGFGQFGRSIAVTAAQRWVAVGAGPLALTVVDRRAVGRLHALGMQHPALLDAIDATCIDVDLGSPTGESIDLLDRRLAEHPPTLVVSAFEDETLAWMSGLFVRRRLRHPVDVVVRTNSDGGFGQQLQTAVSHGEERGRIVSFPVFASACTVDLIEGGVREQLARSIHEDHLLHSGSRGRFHRAWGELDDADRESSRAAADALVERLAAVGAELVPLRHWGDGEEVFDPDELDRLAAAEHARWMDERLAAGWQWGSERDDAARRNPLLVPWDALPDDVRAENRRATAALPAMLARAGFQITRGRILPG